MSDPVGHALVDLAAGREVDADRLAGLEHATLAHRHGLTLPLQRVLHDRPEGRYLGAVVARMAAREGRIDHHMRALLEAMAMSGVRVSIVKGPAIQQRYQDPAIRRYTDLDFVVPAAELDGALEVLRNYPHIGSIPAKAPMGDKRDIVVNDPTGMQFTVDLHWDLFGFRQLGGAAAGAMEEAWSASHFDPDHPFGPMWILPDEAEVGFMTLHAVLDHRFRLILFRDLLELSRGSLSWQRLADFATRHGFGAFHRLAWLIAEHTVGVEVPASFLEMLRRGGIPARVAESLLARVDLVRFDGHRVHPLNLALMLVHDDPSHRRRLLLRAPGAYPGWRRRVQPSVPDDRTVDLLVTSNARRGAEVFGRALTEQLVQRGWAATLVSLRGGELPGVGAVPVSEESRLGGLRLAVLGGLVRRFRSARPTVVFANGGATLRYAVAARLLVPGGPRVVYGSIGEPGFWLRGRIHRLLQRTLIRRCDHVTAVSYATARSLTEILGVPEESVSVIHPGVGDEWFEIEREEGEPGLRILFAGSLSFEKDPSTAVAAVASVTGDVQLRLVGDGPMRPELEARGEPWLEVVGPVEDMRSQMQWANVLLLTSRTEGLPGVAVEASASGIPVIASDVGGVGEIVVDGVTGHLVEAGDVGGFAAALQRLQDDPESRRKMGEQARQRARTQFRIEESTNAFEDVLQRVADR